jgi:hypothetical protein
MVKDGVNPELLLGKVWKRVRLGSAGDATCRSWLGPGGK